MALETDRRATSFKANARSALSSGLTWPRRFPGALLTVAAPASYLWPHLCSTNAVSWEVHPHSWFTSKGHIFPLSFQLQHHPEMWIWCPSAFKHFYVDVVEPSQSTSPKERHWCPPKTTSSQCPHTNKQGSHWLTLTRRFFIHSAPRPSGAAVYSICQIDPFNLTQATFASEVLQWTSN